MTEPCERRTSDRAPELLLTAALLLVALPLPAAAEEFEVLVLRGSTLARVSGDETGPLSEVTLREDPHPPAPRAPRVRDERPFEPEVVIRIERGETERYDSPVWGYPLRRPFEQRQPPRYHLYDWGSRYSHGSYRPGGRPPRSVLFGGPRGLRSQRR
jgi:hypothetical protein